MAKTIAVVNQKGGVGKTTSTVNLAATVAAKGYNVLIVDIDPQGNATSGLGINKRELEKSSYDVLINSMQVEKAMIETEFDNLWVLPSSMTATFPRRIFPAYRGENRRAYRHNAYCSYAYCNRCRNRRYGDPPSARAEVPTEYGSVQEE